jgi:hypothetical protein
MSLKTNKENKENTQKQPNCIDHDWVDLEFSTAKPQDPESETWTVVKTKRLKKRKRYVIYKNQEWETIPLYKIYMKKSKKLSTVDIYNTLDQLSNLKPFTS